MDTASLKHPRSILSASDVSGEQSDWVDCLAVEWRQHSEDLLRSGEGSRLEGEGGEGSRLVGEGGEDSRLEGEGDEDSRLEDK